MSGARATQTSDDDFLSGMPGFEDDAATNTGQDEGEGEGNGAQDRSGGQPDDTGTEQGGRADPAGQQQTADPARIIKRNDGLIERQGQDDPRRRDLVDPVTGQVVARGGIERRIYEQGKRAERESQGLKQEVTQLRGQLQTLQGAGGIGQQLGLSAEAQTLAMQTMANFIRDPVNTLEYLIAEVKAKGHTIPSLQGQGGTDIAAIQRMLDERLAPMRQQEERRRAQEQAQARAQQDLDNFLSDVPDARANLDVIAEMLQAQQGLSLHGAYNRFLLWCSANSLDPTQHVGLQLQARQQPAQQAQPGQQPRQQRPLPNGRQMSGNGTVPAGSRTIDHDTSWENIIRDSMSEAGYQQ